MDAPPILTVGHSTHPIERFLALLRGARIETLADVRRYPGSRRHPQFGADALEQSLADAGIAYEPFGEELGGRRAKADAGPDHPDNSAWRNASFRAYADYMSSDVFEAGLARLIALADEGRTAVMCAESHPSRCHRQLIADALVARGRPVVHLLSSGKLQPHALPDHAVAADGRVSYPDQALF